MKLDVENLARVTIGDRVYEIVGKDSRHSSVSQHPLYTAELVDPNDRLRDQSDGVGFAIEDEERDALAPTPLERLVGVHLLLVPKTEPDAPTPLPLSLVVPIGPGVILGFRTKS
ncbi:MAG TPA: hypothetical protein VJM32_04450 [Candidatus Saccharimonadales bacterium]|nr:hypothetical protein [Candidatus Saccharimonadales bacterium]